MEKNTLSPRQWGRLAWAGLLSPVLHLSPGVLLPAAGAAAWLSPVLAAGPALLLAAFCGAVSRAGGVSALLRAAPVPRLTRAVLGLWTAFCSGVLLRLGAERLVSAVYPESRAATFMVLTAALVLPAAAGGLRPLGRLAELSAPALGILLGTLLLLSAGEVRPDMLSVSPAGALRGAVPFWGVLSGAVFLLFPAGESPALTRRRAVLPLLGSCAAGCALAAAVIGVFGPVLAGRMGHPFFVLLRNLRFLRPAERAETLAAVLWIASDFLLLSLLGHVCARLLRAAGGNPAPVPGLVPALSWAVLSLAAGGLCAPNAFVLQRVAAIAVPAGNGAAAVLLLALWLLRRAEGRRSPSR